MSISVSYSRFLNPLMYMRALLSSFSSTPITIIVIRRFIMLYGILSSHCNPCWQALSQETQSFPNFVKKLYGMGYVKMLWENGSVSQYHHFTINFLPTINPCTNNQIRHTLKKNVFLMSLCLTIFQRDFKNRFQR